MERNNLDFWDYLVIIFGLAASAVLGYFAAGNIWGAVVGVLIVVKIILRTISNPNV